MRRAVLLGMLACGLAFFAGTKLAKASGIQGGGSQVQNPDSEFVNLNTDASGNLRVTSAGGAPPIGASTEAKQDAGNASLSSIDSDIDATLSSRATEATVSAINGKLNSLGQKPMAGSAPVVLASDQSPIPVTQSGVWNISDITGTISLPTGASTGAKQDVGNSSLSSIDGKLNSLGQKTMAGSVPVVISSDQSPVSVSQSGTWNINNISGLISLPTGAATAANQATANGSLSSIDTKSTTYLDFGSASNLAAALNSEVVFDNVNGYQTIGFNLVIPTGATVVFECTFDGTNYESCNIKSATLDAYVSHSFTSGRFIGSLAALRKFRVRVSVAGSASGSVIGRAQNGLSILEGIEFSARPDRQGTTPIHKDVNFSTQQTATSVWTPASNRKFAVTDLAAIITGTADCTVSLYDGTDASGSRVLYGLFDVSINSPLIVIRSYVTPYVSTAVDNVLRLTTSAACNVSIQIEGYEIL